jgi:hypothetical protein
MTRPLLLLLLLLFSRHFDYDCVLLFYICQHQIHKPVKRPQRADSPAPDTSCMPRHNKHPLP